MPIRAMILDFDGTLVTEDLTDLLCELAGKKEESQRLKQLFHEGKLKGLDGLIQRINFLKGISFEQIEAVVAEQDYLRAGARKLFTFLKQNHIISIIASGSIEPLLRIYQKKLDADYVIGSQPVVKNGRLVSISQSNYSGIDFKVQGAATILKKLDIPHDAVAAIGDSPADKGIFAMSGLSIAIDPKAGVGAFADHVIYDDLSKAIPILKNHNAKRIE